MGSSRLQHQRYELKYQVSEDKALRIRDFVQSYLEIDEYGALQPNLSYPTLSLYLDSDWLDTYWHAINGNRNRFKLRLRYYDDQPDTPVSFEIKRHDRDSGIEVYRALPQMVPRPGGNVPLHADGRGQVL